MSFGFGTKTDVARILDRIVEEAWLPWIRLNNLIDDDTKSNNDDLELNFTLPKPIKKQYNTLFVLLKKCNNKLINDIGSERIKSEVKMLQAWKIEWDNIKRFGYTKKKIKGCQYHDMCHNIFRKYLYSVYSSDDYVGYSDYCFCNNCHKKRGDKEVYYRGKPLRKYIIPIGWARMGMPERNQNKVKRYNILSDWNVSFHGTKYKNISNIAKSGFIFLKPGDYTFDGKLRQITLRSKEEHGLARIQNGFKRKNEYTGKQEMFDPNSIFTSPTIKYAALPQYATPKKFTYNGETVLCQFAFQLRQEPGTYKIGQTTSGTKDCDTNISWKEYEYYTKNNFSIFVHGLLIKVTTPNDKDYKYLLSMANKYS